MLQVLNFTDQTLVVEEERCLGFKILVDQCILDENLTGFLWMDLAVVDPALAVDGQTIQRSPFHGGDLCRFLFPVRFAPGFTDQMMADTFQPFRLDLGDTPCIETAGIHQFRRHDPASVLFRKGRAWPDAETDTPGAQEDSGVFRLAADVAQQSRQQGDMQLFISCIQLTDGPATLTDNRQQLRMDIAPFPQAQVGEELAPAVFLQFPVRFLMFNRILKPFPDLEIAEEFRAVVGKFLMGVVCGVLSIHWTVSWILDGQCGGNHQHFFQAQVVTGGKDHAADAWVKREHRQLTADCRHLVHLIQSTQFLKQLITVSNRLAHRHFHEREGIHIDQTQGFHPQDDRSKRGAQDFRCGVLLALQEILFVIQTDTDAGFHTSATAGTLVGGRL